MRGALRDPIGLAGAGLATLLAAVLSAVVFGRVPHVQDSIAQLFQARIFAHGRLWMPSPPLREFFEYAHIINDGRWYAQYPPGHSLLLVPGVWLGAPWIVNPLLGGLSVLGVFVLGREAFGTVVARAAVVLALLSPFLLLMASEFMSHVGGLFAITWFLVYALRTLRAGAGRDAWIGGAFLLLATLVRPYTALACALPVFVAGAWRLALRRPVPSRSTRAGSSADSPGSAFFLWRPLAILAAGGAAGILLYGLYNWGTTGDPLTPGYIKLHGPSHGLGFGKGSWGPPHTLMRGLRHAGANLAALNRDLLAWPLTSLWPLLIGLLPVGAGRPRAVAGTLPGVTALLAAVPVSLLVLYVFYWYHDLCFGPRYLYESLGPIFVLSGLGLVRTAGLLLGGGAGAARQARGEAKPARPGARPPRNEASRGSAGRWRWVLLAALGGVLAAYAGLIGWSRLFRATPEAAAAPPASPVRMGSYFQHYGREFWGVSPRLGQIVDSQVSGRALVFVRFLEFEPRSPQVRHLWFGSAFARLDPDLRNARIVYAKDRGDENARLAALFPDRASYLYTGTIEGGTVTPWRPGL